MHVLISFARDSGVFIFIGFAFIPSFCPRIAHIALSPEDINAPQFWRILNLGVYEGQERDLHLLKGKIDVRVRTMSTVTGELQVKLDEYCALTGAEGKKRWKQGEILSTMRNCSCCAFHTIQYSFSFNTLSMFLEHKISCTSRA